MLMDNAFMRATISPLLERTEAPTRKAARRLPGTTPAFGSKGTNGVLGESSRDLAGMALQYPCQRREYPSDSVVNRRVANPLFPATSAHCPTPSSGKMVYFSPILPRKHPLARGSARTQRALLECPFEGVLEGASTPFKFGRKKPDFAKNLARKAPKFATFSNFFAPPRH